MGLIYGYLIAWIAGGVLLAAGMLLSPRRLRTAEQLLDGAVLADAAAEAALANVPIPTSPPAWLGPFWLGLVAFGGAGLSLEALAWLEAGLRPVAAAGAGLALCGLGLLLLRRPA